MNNTTNTLEEQYCKDWKPYGAALLLEFNEVISYLGQPVKQDSKHAYYQCPDCRDYGQDNLVYTFANGLLKSWCCESSKRIFGEIIKLRNQQQPEKTLRSQNAIPKQNEAKPELTQDQITRFYTYQHDCNKALLKNEKSLQFLYKKRGITKETVEFCGLGIDTDKSFWAIPVYSFDNLVGFEYRKSDFKDFEYQGKTYKCKKEPGTKSCMAQINGKLPSAEILVILEGFLDGYVFWQHLHEKNQNEFYNILTPSNGVGTVIGLLKNFDFSPYKKVILYLDSDEKGIKAMNEAKRLYPFIETVIMNCGCKDFNEHYLRCVA